MDLTKENGNNGDHGAYSYGPSSGYALSGKIMLSAVVILFTVVIVFVCLHIYARWYLLRARRRHREQRTRRRTHIIFSYEPSAATDNTAFALSRGLEESVLRSLPTFVYSSATHGGGVLECAVCLSEFEDNEKGRLLPKCNHSFHIDCIDMWFQSHSTCPLCRTPVSSEIPAPSLPNENPAEVAIRVAESESGPSSGICPSCRFDSSTSSYSQPSSSSSSPPYSADSSSLKTRAVTVSIEVPRRNGSFRGLEEGELCLGSPRGQGFKSPGGQQGLKSPGGRILSLKRILSREWKGCVSPSSVAGGSYSAAAAADIDLENGEERPRSSSTQ